MEHVAPFVGAWIEIATTTALCSVTRSLPSWERGLKYDYGKWSGLWRIVAPFVGAWIEMQMEEDEKNLTLVAPFVGAWIEISCIWSPPADGKSLPSWERGLKSFPVRNTPTLH